MSFLQQSILILGFGSIGQGLLPMLLKHFSLQAAQITLIAADDEGADEGMVEAQQFGLSIKRISLDQGNYATVLAQHLQAGDLLINVSVDVASLSLLQWCQAQEVFYLDTCVEPWAGSYRQGGIAASNYMLRHAALSEAAKPYLRAGVNEDSRETETGKATAVIAHGANPGLISHLLKEALESLAALRGISHWASWAALAQQLGVQVVQVAERDTQHSNIAAAPGHFYNTWSVDGLMAEAWQGAELGWGTHERTLPVDAEYHEVGDGSGIYLQRHSAELRVRSWVPAVGEQQAWLITHHEALSIAHLLTLPGDDIAQPRYRPTVYYAYSPSPIAARSLQYWQASGYQPPQRSQVLRDELISGFDQLGVLLIFAAGTALESGKRWQAGAYWYGSTLTLQEARQLGCHNSATSMQVVAGILGALSWMQQHPRAGVVEAESMDHREIMQVARPYLGQVAGVMTDWQPAGGLQFQDFVVENADAEAGVKAVMV